MLGAAVVALAVNAASRLTQPALLPAAAAAAAALALWVAVVAMIARSICACC